MTARTHALLEKRKGLKENVGLDFSISFENWLNLWKYKHWKLVEAQLQTRCALYSAFCVCVFLYFLLSLLSVYFSCFQCSWFSVSSSVFFPDAPSSFFGLLYSWFCHLYFLNPPPPPFFFYTNQPSIHTKMYVRHLWDIYWTNFTSLLLGCLLLLLLCRKQWIRWPKNRSLMLFNLGAVHTNPEKINAVSKMSRFVWTRPLGPVYKEGG